jgi:sugar phosphate isomerase/epimerase
MKRRLFALACSVLVAPFVDVLAAVHGAPMTNSFYAMDTAFQRPGLNAAQQLDLVRDLGYAGIAWHEEAPAQARAAALEAEACGLAMFTIYCAAQVTPAGELTRSPELPVLMESLKGHHTIIWLHLGGEGPAIAALTGGEPVVKELRALAEMASANGLRIALYPHFGEWTARFADAVRVARLVRHPALGVTFNLCHCLAAGDEQRIPALLEEAAPVLTTVTINGADSGVQGPNWNRLIQPLNQGSFDVGLVLRQLSKIGFTGPIGFQGYGISGDARSILQPTMARWRELTSAGTSDSTLSLFDGKTFTGWEGDTNRTWRIRNGEIVGGSLEANVPRNEFLCTTRPFTNFILRLKFKLAGKSGFINAGVQFRSQRVKDPPNEMAGYQADIGDPDYWGSIYDEGIRNKTLVKADMAALNRVLKRSDWNEYVIRAEGRRVRLWINGLQTVDYTEPEEQRTQWGIIGLQIHGGAVAEARYKDLTLEELPGAEPR